MSVFAFLYYQGTGGQKTYLPAGEFCKRRGDLGRQAGQRQGWLLIQSIHNISHKDHSLAIYGPASYGSVWLDVHHCHSELRPILHILCECGRPDWGWLLSDKLSDLIRLPLSLTQKLNITTWLEFKFNQKFDIKINYTLKLRFKFPRQVSSRDLFQTALRSVSSCSFFIIWLE